MTVRFVEMDRLLTTSKRVTKTENKKRERGEEEGRREQRGREEGTGEGVGGHGKIQAVVIHV